MSPTAERIAPLNLEINPGSLNLGGQVPPHGTQPAQLRSLCDIVYMNVVVLNMIYILVVNRFLIRGHLEF